ncbi:hypothetical protein AZ046_001407, partial [Klebsiella pneumoniae]
GGFFPPPRLTPHLLFQSAIC